jgi:2'-5' RNA ligase
VKSAKNRKELIRVIKQLSEASCGIQEITSIALKQSILKPEGPQYSNLYEIHARNR